MRGGLVVNYLLMLGRNGDGDDVKTQTFVGNLPVSFLNFFSFFFFRTARLIFYAVINISGSPPEIHLQARACFHSTLQMIPDVS